MNDAVTEMDFDRDGYPALCSGKARCIEKAHQDAVLPDPGVILEGKHGCMAHL